MNERRPAGGEPAVEKEWADERAREQREAEIVLVGSIRKVLDAILETVAATERAAGVFSPERPEVRLITGLADGGRQTRRLCGVRGRAR